MIKRFYRYILEHYDEFSFDALYSKMPDELKDIFEKLKTIEQRPDKHPEGDVYTHISLVVNRLSKFKNINLSLAGVFHDIGKLDTHTYNDEKGFYQHPDHQRVSLKYIKKYKSWIEEMGGDYDVIYQIVEYHMYIKSMDEMRKSKQMKIKNLPYYDLIQKFTSCDYGGF